MNTIAYYITKLNSLREKLINILRDKNVNCNNTDTFNKLISHVGSLTRDLKPDEKIPVTNFSLSFFQGSQEEIDAIINSLDITSPITNLKFKFAEMPNLRKLDLTKFNLAGQIQGVLEMFDPGNEDSGYLSPVEEIIASNCDLSYTGDNEAFDNWIFRHSCAPLLKKLDLSNSKICRMKLAFLLHNATKLEELNVDNMVFTENSLVYIFDGGVNNLNRLDLSKVTWELPIVATGSFTSLANLQYLDFGNILFDNATTGTFTFRKLNNFPFSEYTLKNSTFKSLKFSYSFSESDTPVSVILPETTITTEAGISFDYCSRISHLDISKIILTSPTVTMFTAFDRVGYGLTDDEINDSDFIIDMGMLAGKTIKSFAYTFRYNKILKGDIKISDVTLASACPMHYCFFGSNVKSVIIENIALENNKNAISFAQCFRDCQYLENLSITMPKGNYTLTALIYQSPMLKTVYLNIPTCNSSGGDTPISLNSITHYNGSGGGESRVFTELKEFIFENMYLSDLPATNATYNTGGIYENHLPYLETVKLINCRQNIIGLNRFMYRSKAENINIEDIDGSKMAGISSSFTNAVNLINLKFMSNYGKGFTTKSNDGACTLDLKASVNLTHESLMDVINKLYDLNLTYNVAAGNTPVYQSLQFGATNLEKLTAEEIAIATNKNWIVS